MSHTFDLDLNFQMLIETVEKNLKDHIDGQSLDKEIILKNTRLTKGIMYLAAKLDRVDNFKHSLIDLAHDYSSQVISFLEEAVEQRCIVSFEVVREFLSFLQESLYFFNLIDEDLEDSDSI